MEQELNLTHGLIDSMELLSRFILDCKNKVEGNESDSPHLTYADIVTAVYYYRSYPDVNDFIEKHLAGNKDYFLLQWVRSTWATFDKMTQEELADLVINQVTLVANSREEQ